MGCSDGGGTTPCQVSPTPVLLLVPTLCVPAMECGGCRAVGPVHTLALPFPRREGRQESRKAASPGPALVLVVSAASRAGSGKRRFLCGTETFSMATQPAGRALLGCSSRGALGTRWAAPAARASGDSSRSPRGLEEGKGCPEAAAHGLSSSPCPPWDAERGWAPRCGLNKGLGGASTVCSARAELPGRGAAVPKLPGILASSTARNCLIYKQIILK